MNRIIDENVLTNEFHWQEYCNDEHRKDYRYFEFNDKDEELIIHYEKYFEEGKRENTYTGNFQVCIEISFHQAGIYSGQMKIKINLPKNEELTQEKFDQLISISDWRKNW